MIKERDVLRIKVPYPAIDSTLAVQAHMYICETASHPDYNFIKCQTLKPYMIGNDVIKHYCDEDPDINRNPFKRRTRIDCDKLFLTSQVLYHEKLRATARVDVCSELFCDVKIKLQEDGYLNVEIASDELAQINSLVTLVAKKG